MPFATVPEAVEEIRAGRILIVVDDEDRENEGDLTVAAEKVTPEIINFMATHGRGLICLTLTPERCDALRLPLMSPLNTSNFGTAFCESIDARQGVTTGISAADRTRTILTAIDPDCRPGDLARPGHIFPLRAREGGVLVRAGQTEASVDLSRMAGLTHAGVICEIMNPDGTMARVPQLQEFCETHGLKMISVADLIRYRLKTERFVRRVAEGVIQTEFGEFRSIAYSSDLNPEYHLALVRGEVAGEEGVLVRMPLRGRLRIDQLRLRAPGEEFVMQNRRGRPRRAGLPARDGTRFPCSEGRPGYGAHAFAWPRIHALRE
jgi:3,4-dihydroxy 2-butanone 4-phosphate synthase / GTP cyclohydrolase II